MDNPPIQYFVSRPGGSITPLVPVDELPAHISIRGVPPRLSPEQTHGMISLGISHRRGEPFVVDADNVPHMGHPGSPRRASRRRGVHTLNAHGDDMTGLTLRILGEERGY